MATYFSVNKSKGNGNDTISITPLESFKGRGPVTNTVVVTSDDDPNVKGSVVCVNTSALSKIGVNVLQSTSATGSFSQATINGGNIDIPNTAYYLKFTVSATNAKKIYVGTMPSYLSIKIGSNFIQANGTLATNQVDIKSLLSSNGNAIPVPNDPGLTGEFSCEIVVGFSANVMAESKSTALNVSLVGTPDTDKNAIFNGNVVQAAASPTMTVTPATLTWDSTETGAKTVTVKSNDDWNVSIS